MDVRRSVNCQFWTDEWIEKLSVEAKLLFIYLLTCPLSNILGIYKISLSRISFESGLKTESIQKHLKSFESIKKVLYINGFVIITNHLKHQALNPNMKKNVINDFDKLPNELKTKLKLNASEGFESLSNGLQMLSEIEIEIEIKKEIEIESEKRKKMPKFIPPTLEEVKEYFKLNNYKEEVGIRAFNHYNVADWKDTAGKQVLNWKQKMQGVWFKDENKEPAKTSLKW